jgi:hypothetical protein
VFSLPSNPVQKYCLIHWFNHSIITDEKDERFSIESKYPELGCRDPNAPRYRYEGEI